MGIVVTVIGGHDRLLLWVVEGRVHLGSGRRGGYTLPRAVCGPRKASRTAQEGFRRPGEVLVIG